jgi:hypothetical protein
MTNKWDGESGLGHTSKIVEAYFEYDDEYEATRLILECEGTAGERVERLKCGADWMPTEDGRYAEHPSKETFNKNAGIMKFIKSVSALDGGREILESRGEPTDAYVWKGLTIGFDQAEASVTVATSISADGAPALSVVKDKDAVCEKVEALWVETKPDHTKFVETVFAQVGEVLLDPELTKWVETSSNWA